VRLSGMRRSTAAPAVETNVSTTRSRRSFSALYEDHAPAALRLAYLLTGERELAEDLMQEAFAKVLGRYGDLRRPDAFDAYLRRTVINLTHTTFRRRRLERAYVVRERQEVAVVSTFDDPDFAAQEELWQRLQRLAPRQRSALVLRFYLDISERESAELLGCSVGSVKSLVSRGLDALRHQLDEEGKEP
jgi:RNA polymerase sigma-70 factor (sigma-E family)